MQRGGTVGVADEDQSERGQNWKAQRHERVPDAGDADGGRGRRRTEPVAVQHSELDAQADGAASGNRVADHERGLTDHEGVAVGKAGQRRLERQGVDQDHRNGGHHQCDDPCRRHVLDRSPRFVVVAELRERSARTR